MSATFTQKIARVFHLGRLPARVREQMQSEGGILYLAEGIAETAIFRNFRAPGVYCSQRRMGFIGFFALSERRIVARAGCFHKIDVNTTFDDPTFKKLLFKAGPKYLSVTFDPSIQTPDASGQIEIRLHLPDISKAATILKENGAWITGKGAAT
ncbi:MAG TPA: hypothetical protein VMZ06_15290 [Candidatus Bathyarchaeia archaeon]|nr:hypothetical protein [Candidatus Bathyarchaeia archaeon]